MSNKNDLHLEEGEKEILIDHAYDGIQELNHPLPFWWSFTFYAGIVFALFYTVASMTGNMSSLQDEFIAEHKENLKLQAEFKKQNSSFDSAKYEAILKDDGIKKGKLVYETHCKSCHKENGAGGIGPNLTDQFWIHSKATPETNYPVVFTGVPDEGMPNWSEKLTDTEIYQVVAYVQSLKNTNAPEGKKPVGNKIED